MKLINIIPFIAISTAFVVIPDEDALRRIEIVPKKASKSFFDRVTSNFEDQYQKSIRFTENALDKAISTTEEIIGRAKGYSPDTFEAFNVDSWLDSASNIVGEVGDQPDDPHHPHHPDDPHHPHHPDDPHHPHHPKHPPHHGHCKSNHTIYELISKSKYTTKLAKAIDEFDDLVELLNSTSAANYTFFAPTDDAFKHCPHEKPSKEDIKAILKYHFTPDIYPLRRLLRSHTIPSYLTEDALGGQPQRLRFGITLRGLTINFASHFKAINIGASNGIIHAIDHILHPPPSIQTIISLLPGEFSTLKLALLKTGLDEDFAKAHSTGATFFAPSNHAFQMLGPKVNAYLFSDAGKKCLRALMKYHIVVNQTLYSDAFYHDKALDIEHIPVHIDLPTCLEGRTIGVDIARYGRLINMRLNGYNDVAVIDGIARDGVLQVPRYILVPPRTPGGMETMGEELTVEDFVSRFDGLLDGGENDEAKEAAGWDL